MGIVIAAGVTTTVSGQAVKGSFLGTVRDSSGAVVPGARVTVRNVDTNVAAVSTANSAGEYIVPFLDSGTYNLTADMQGFKTSLESGVKLDVAAKVRVDFTLQVGEPTERVEVSSAEPLVETDSSSVGMAVTSEKLQQLPMVGRNFQQLAQLAPTSVSSAFSPNNAYVPGLSRGEYYQVGGQRGSYTEYTSDGVDNNNISYQVIGVLPSLDTIQEFKVLDHNFSAEYGRGTVKFITTTKQGTNQLHGSTYEYVRNEVFDANSFFSNRTNTKKRPYRYNQFGLTLGGPIDIPRLYNGKDKSFFFLGYEGTRFSTSGTAFAKWPTPQMVSGDFSNLTNPDGSRRLIYDPATTRPDGQGGYIRDPFPGNIIRPDRFDPVSQAELQFIPKPTSLVDILPNVNTVTTAKTISSPNNWVVRIDHNFSTKDRLYGRYAQSKETMTSTGLAPLSGTFGVHNGYNMMLSEVHVFNANVANELRLGYNRSNLASYQEGGPAGCIGGPCPSGNIISDVLHLKNLVGGTNPIANGVPGFLITGYSATGGSGGNPLVLLNNNYQISDNLVITRGRHSIKLGLNIERTRFNFANELFGRGQFTFNGQFTQGTQAGQTATGNAVADFLLGLSNLSSGLAGDASVPMRTGNQGYYAQDDWRANSKLTLNLGLRWEYYNPFVALADNKISQFIFGSVPGSCFGASCPPGYIQVYGKGQRFYDRNWNDWAPRVGLAYSPFGNNKTAIRAAYGIFYSPTDATDNGTWGMFNPPSTLAYNLLPDNPFTDLSTTKVSNLFPGGVIPPLAQLRTDTWPLAPITIMTEVPRMEDAAVQEWNLSIQHAIRANLLLEVGYMGSHGVHGSRRIDYNQARLDPPGVITPISSRLPYPKLGSVMYVSEHSASSKYEAGYLRLERRFASGFSFVSSYTFAKTMDDYGNLNGAGHWWPQNAYNKAAEMGLSAFDAKHRFTAGYVWELPLGRGKHWGSHMNAVADALAGGWQVNGITTLQTGFPLFPITARDNSNTGAFLGPAGGGRPDCVGPVHYLNPRQTLMWFDPSAFATPAFGTFGNCGTGVLIGPGNNNFDLSASKNFHLHERVSLQFRAEMFNAFNHTQFTYSGCTSNANTAACNYSVIRIDPTLTPQQEAGINSTLPPRNIQFGLRLSF